MYQWCKGCNQDMMFTTWSKDGICDYCLARDAKTRAFDVAFNILHSKFMIGYIKSNNAWKAGNYEPGELSYESIAALCSIPQLERC